MRLVITIGNLADSIVKIVLTAAMAALLVIMGTQVVYRYGLNASLIWAEEICRYLLVWVSFLGCGLAYERGEIAAVTLLRDALPGTQARIAAIIGNLLSLILIAALVYYGARYALLAGVEPIPAMQFLFNDLFGPGVVRAPAVCWVYMALPVGLALMGLRIAAGMFSSHPPEPDPGGMEL